MTEADKETTKPLDPETTLRITASKFRILDKAADEALAKGKANKQMELLQKRADLIINLPEQLEQAIQSGTSFPENELQNVCEFAEFAQRSLEAGDPFSLGALLEFRGRQPSEKNMLEELIDRLYPSRK